MDRLLIHEFGHDTSGDHLSDEYHEALCRLGAGMKRLALEKPEELRRFSEVSGLAAEKEHRHGHQRPDVS